MNEKIQNLEEVLPNEVSPYRFCKIFNKVFGVDLPPQMFYTYVKKGYIATSTNNTNKLFIRKDECVRFATKYFERKEEKSSK